MSLGVWVTQGAGGPEANPRGPESPKAGATLGSLSQGINSQPLSDFIWDFIGDFIMIIILGDFWSKWVYLNRF